MNQIDNAQAPNIHKQNYIIRSYEVDAAGTLSIPTVFNLLQDAASNHAYNLGVSVAQLMASNYTWVLSRMVVRMFRFPTWRESLTVRTWPSGIQTVFALRDFEIRDARNRMVACAVSAWIIIDAEKRRPVRPTAFADQLNPIEGRHVLPHPLNKLPGIADPGNPKPFIVRYHDVDINQHVNNVSYIAWLLESIPEFGQSGCRLSELEVNFLGEARLGEKIMAMSRPESAGSTAFNHSIVRAKDHRELIRAKTGWAMPVEDKTS